MIRCRWLLTLSILTLFASEAAVADIRIETIERASAFSLHFAVMSSINPLAFSLSNSNACLSTGLSVLEYDRWWFAPLTGNGWGIGLGFGSCFLTFRTTDNQNVFRYRPPGIFDLPFYDFSIFPLKVHLPFYSRFEENGHKLAWLEFHWNFAFDWYQSMELAVHLEWSILSATVGWLYYRETIANNLIRPAYSGIFMEITIPFESYSQLDTGTNKIRNNGLAIGR